MKKKTVDFGGLVSLQFKGNKIIITVTMEATEYTAAMAGMAEAVHKEVKDE